jgi:hypothetical protein
MSASRFTCRTRITAQRVSGRSTLVIPTHGSPGVPHSVWLPPNRVIKAPAVADTVLPVWALDRIRAQFAPDGGHAAVLFGPGPARTAQSPHPTALAPDWLAAAEPVDLTESPAAPLLRLAVVLAEPLPHEPDPDPATAALFYRELATALAPGGVVVVHTHPHHTRAGLTDPAGGIVRAARAAGFTYLQHLVVVQHRLGARTARRFTHPRQRPVAPVHRRIHTDLYAFTPRKDGDPR